jgi:phage baseplate assembly protein W
MSTELISDKNLRDTRSKITGTTRQYRDLSLGFRAHPEYGDISPVKDLEAIKNSIRNILKTNRGEKPFNPKFGCGLKNYLFEPADGITKASIRDEIMYSLGIQEPRVQVTDVAIEDYPDKNAYAITIFTTVVNTQQQFDLQLLLKRLR